MSWTFVTYPLLGVQRSTHMVSAGGLKGLPGIEQGIDHRCGHKVGELREVVAMPGESQGVQRLQLLSWRKPVFFILIRLCSIFLSSDARRAAFGSSRHLAIGGRQWWVVAVNVLLDAPDCF